MEPGGSRHRACAVEDAGLLVASKGDLSVDIEATATGQRCTVKRMGVTLFRGVSLEATLTTEAHDRQVAAKALRIVESVCMTTDGDHLEGESEIPVGEVMRMILEAEEAFGIEREAGESDD